MLESKTLRINWCREEGELGLGKCYGTYDLSQDAYGWKEIFTILDDMSKGDKVYYKVSDQPRQETEPFEDFNHALVLHYFGIDVNYY